MAEVMTLGFQAQRLDQRLTQALAVSRMRTQQALEIQRVVVAEAEHQLALGGDAHTVAVAAEIVTVRRDEPHLGLRADHMPVARRPAGDLAAAQQRMALFDTLAHLVAGAEGLLAAMADHTAQRHLLDEADIQAAFDGELEQVQHLVVVAPALHNTV